MSLVCWLPLNGDLHNQGCSNASVTNTSATINTAGKIGSCYSFGTSKSYLKFDNIDFIHNFTECSVSLWLKILSWNTSYATYFQFGLGSTPWAHYIFGLLRNSSASTLCFTISNGSSATNAGCLTPALELNTWYHLTLTYTAGHCKIYVNGVETKDYSTTIVPNFAGITTGTIGAANNLTSYQTNCLINDFRVYDHCLSAAEVREISQGLVLHYKLDGGLFGNPNVLTNSTGNLGSTAGWSGVISLGTNESSPYLIASRTNTTSSSRTFVSHGNIKSLISWATAGTHFTLSGYYKVPSSATYNVQANMFLRWTHTAEASAYTDTGWSTPNSTAIIKDKWIFFEQHYTVPTNYVDGAINFYLSAFSTGLSTVYWKDIKLEKGDTATLWCPADSELDIDRTVVEDSSGYNHNGTILNTVSISSDTPRYSYSTKLEAANSMINCGRGGMVTDSITVNMWIKSSAWANPVSCTESGGWNFEGTGNYFRFPVYVSGVGYKYGQSSTTKAQICNNEWHMLTGIYDRINQKVQIYVDGQLDNDYATGTSNNIGYHGSNCIWIGAEATGSNTTASNGMAGLFSDFRIYCTALDADAIRQLYEVGAKVDKRQNLHAFELNESNSGRELMAIPLTSAYNSNNIYSGYNNDGEITLTGKTSIGSPYIKINPQGKKYYFDADISVDANNQIYIGFQRYDASKTARSNDATMYAIAIKPTAALVHQHYHIVYDTAATISNETSNFGYFNANTPVDTIRLRILNDWSSQNSRTATIHRLSVREVPSLQNSKINKRGQVITDELIEMDSDCRIQKNGTIEANEIIEL